jgi:AmmeMemoRadiSam system protein A
VSRVIRKLIIVACLGVLLASGGACKRKEPVAAVTPAPKETSPAAPGGDVSRPAETDDEKLLLAIARESLRMAVEEGKTYEPPQPASEELRAERGVFVTLTEGGELRGCIGYPLPVKPLYLAVRDNAVNAALNDPRFMPVRKAELRDLDVEISVMTPLQPVKDPQEIVVGEDGLMIEARGRSGLLLPQVAPEQGWDRNQLLDGICRKAGLPADAYAWPDAKLSKFRAHIFGGSYTDE